jgi:hypothetical protein
MTPAEPLLTRLPSLGSAERSARRQAWDALRDDCGAQAPVATAEQANERVRIVGPRTERRAEIEAKLPAFLSCPLGALVERAQCLDCGRVEDRCSLTKRYLAGDGIQIPRVVSRAPEVEAPVAPQQGPSRCFVLDAETLALLATRMPNGARYTSVEDRQAAKKRTASLGYLRSEVRRFAAAGDKERFDRAVAGLRRVLAGEETTEVGEAAAPVLPTSPVERWLALGPGYRGEDPPVAVETRLDGVTCRPGSTYEGHLRLFLDNVLTGEQVEAALRSLGSAAAAIGGRFRAWVVITPEEVDHAQT